ncbi:hypothetical protein R3P38DRAFT_3570028, partial [Favolaschia claudopus]
QSWHVLLGSTSSSSIPRPSLLRRHYTPAQNRLSSGTRMSSHPLLQFSARKSRLGSTTSTTPSAGLHASPSELLCVGVCQSGASEDARWLAREGGWVEEARSVGSGGLEEDVPSGLGDTREGREVEWWSKRGGEGGSRNLLCFGRHSRWYHLHTEHVLDRTAFVHKSLCVRTSLAETASSTLSSLSAHRSVLNEMRRLRPEEGYEVARSPDCQRHPQRRHPPS